MFTYLPLKPIPTFFLKNKSNNVFNRKKIKKKSQILTMKRYNNLLTISHHFCPIL